MRQTRLRSARTIEKLEDRRVLSVPPLEVHPQGNIHSALDTTEIRATYDREVDASSVTLESLIAHSAHTGLVANLPGGVAASGTTVKLTSDRPLFAGELVQVTATDRIRSAESGEALAPYVWQFRTQVTTGTALFGSTRQALGEQLIFSPALADLDGDGDLDVFSGNGVEDFVWLNDGSGEFVDSGQRLGDTTTFSVALGDLDADGDVDAFAAHGGCRIEVPCPNQVWLNNGSGTFVDSGQRFGDRRSESVALGDLDGDGDLDAFVGNGYARMENNLDQQANTVWLNDGRGNFIDSGQRLGLNETGAVALGDVDGDGDLDAVAANRRVLRQADGANRVWLNDGRGNFTDSGQRLGELSSVAVRLGDLDADGDLDAYVGNESLVNPTREYSAAWINNGQGQFTKGQVDIVNPADRDRLSTNEIDLGDVDGDGDLDVFLVTFSGNRLLLNDGNARFSVADQDLSRFQGMGVSMGDVDADGDLDVVAGNTGVWLNAEIPADLSVTISNDQSVATPGQPITYQVVVTNHGPHDAAAAVSAVMPSGMEQTRWTCEPTSGSWCGISGDGDVMDTVSLLAGHTATYTVTGMLKSVLAESAVVATATVDLGMGVDDLDRTNNLAQDTDVVAGLRVSPTMNATSVPAQTTITRVFDQAIDSDTVSPQSFVVQAMTTGQLLAPAVETRVDGESVVASVARSFSPGELVQVSSTSRISTLDDASPTQRAVWQFRAVASRASGIFQLQEASFGTFSAIQTLELGDLDGDGDLDAFGGHFQRGPQGANTVWLNEGQGTFADSGQRLGESPTISVALGDVDGDGDLDAFAANRDQIDPAPDMVWLNDGQGNFVDSGQRLGRSASNDVAVGDLDGDGDLDALVGGLDAAGTVWINDGQGQFHELSQPFTDSSTYSVALADVDGDGDLDALLDNPNNEVWLNDGEGTFNHSGQPLRPIHGRVGVGDLNGDGAVDAVFGGEIWLNSGAGQFSDTGGRVQDGTSVALGDIEGDGDLDLLIGHISLGSSLWLNDGTGGFIEAQFLRQSYGYSASLADVDEDGDLDAVLTDLRTQVWHNHAAPGDVNGDGRFDQFDITQVLSAAKYDTGEPARWQEGDWNLDGVFDRLDLVFALQSGFDRQT